MRRWFPGPEVWNCIPHFRPHLGPHRLMPFWLAQLSARAHVSARTGSASGRRLGFWAMESSRAASAEAEAVRAACRRTLAEHGARIYLTVVTLCEDGWTEPWMWQVGDADPNTRRLHLSSCVSDQSPVVKAFGRLEQRWPWLADEDQAENEPPMPVPERIYIGRRAFLRARAGWRDEGNQSNTTGLGLWALEAAQGMRTASVAPEKNVRGERCRCYLGEVRPADVVGQPGIELVIAPEPDNDWRAMLAEVSIDDAGLVRRIACSPTVGRRQKPGLLFKLLERLEHRVLRTEPPAQDPEFQNRTWAIVELWDHGCPVTIEPPTPLIEPDPPPNKAIAIAHNIIDWMKIITIGLVQLWKKRRAYRRRMNEPTSTARPHDRDPRFDRRRRIQCGLTVLGTPVACCIAAAVAMRSGGVARG